MRFDIDTYAETGGRLDIVDLEIDDAFAEQPLDAEALRCLQYMHDVENHTVCYLRDMLVTKAHSDPEITTFLTLWNYQEHWHGEALARVLLAHGLPAGRARVAALRRSQGRLDRLRPLAFMLGSAVLPDVSAIHMAWGAINEWTTQAGYGLLARRAGHPVLTELLGRIMRQEASHIEYYSSEAGRRLARSRPTQRVTRLALRRWWSPVGAGVRPESEVAFTVSYLFGSEQGQVAAARIDRRIDRLPGLAGLRLIEGAADRYRGTGDDGGDPAIRPVQPADGHVTGGERHGDSRRRDAAA